MVNEKKKERFEGTVKWFGYNNFGFIKQDDVNEDLFVHANDVSDFILKEGDRVSFEIDDSSPKGKKAINVELIEAMA